MKRKLLISISILAVLTSLCYARMIGWDKTEKPPVELGEALKLATNELTKQGYVDFYCIGASLAKTFSDGDWELYFSSKEGKTIWVNVDSHKKIKISDSGFEHY